jgi:hypothetical protein
MPMAVASASSESARLSYSHELQGLPSTDVFAALRKELREAVKAAVAAVSAAAGGGSSSSSASGMGR